MVSKKSRKPSTQNKEGFHRAFSAWNPDSVGRVRAIVPNGSTVFIGGDFSSIGGKVQGGLAAPLLTTGADQW